MHLGADLWKRDAILLITLSFPHYPQVFPQAGFDTKSKVFFEGVDIIVFDLLRQNAHFFTLCIFHYKEKIRRKNMLDR